MFAFVLAIVLIYLILAAQFESFKDPLVIMLTVPLAVAVAGALVFMYAGGQTMNIFSQIGIIMLIGLVAKNGILIVEFANQKQESGLARGEAIEQAALQRLRPILMTSASTVLGLIPAGFGYRRGGCRPRGDGCGRRRRHARLDPADALHRSGHVQLYFHRQTQKESMRRFLSLTWGRGAACPSCPRRLPIR